MGKPGTTRKSARFQTKYWAYKNELLSQIKGFILPESNIRIVFYLPMPKSWSPKMKGEFMNQPHQQKPDVDNILKGFFDCLCKEDKMIWDVRATKKWSDEGQIDIYEID